MRRKELKIIFVEQLSELYDSREAENIFFLVVDHFMGINRLEFSMDQMEEISAEQESKFKGVLDALQTGKPIQQVLGFAWFFDLQFYVNEHVLIPRPETEELVDWILKSSTQIKHAHVLDVGTGSGCIVLSLANAKANWDITAWDLSKPALEVAEKNSESFGLKNVKFECVDVLDERERDSIDGIDILVSNPPYIAKDERNTLSANVLDFEPHEALFVTNSDPLQFYRAICTLGKNKLASKGMLYFECHENYAHDVSRLMQEYGFEEVELRNDMQGKARMVRGLKP